LHSREAQSLAHGHCARTKILTQHSFMRVARVTNSKDEEAHLSSKEVAEC
jgi:hypothetical protein